MILSFHPCYVADRNLICAGRDPDPSDLDAIARADAVILPQGCRRTLFEMAAKHCPHVFPDYRVRFAYPGKSGQARLFDALAAPQPATIAFSGVEELARRYPMWRRTPPMALPLVFKYDWGGQGDSVHLVTNLEDLGTRVAQGAEMEKSGWAGFVLQALVPAGGRSLRVAVIGQHVVSYWRVQDDPTRFGASLAEGGRIDRRSDPDLQRLARSAVGGLCDRTGIDLAGFDLLLATGAARPQPLFLEINWFFGRSGLGGSERFYALLTRQISRWLAGLGLGSVKE